MLVREDIVWVRARGVVELEEMRDLIPQRKKRRTRVRKLPKVPIHES